MTAKMNLYTSKMHNR